jgi:hypothetical protein
MSPQGSCPTACRLQAAASSASCHQQILLKAHDQRILLAALNEQASTNTLDNVCIGNIINSFRYLT